MARLQFHMLDEPFVIPLLGSVQAPGPAIAPAPPTGKGLVPCVVPGAHDLGAERLYGQHDGDDGDEAQPTRQPEKSSSFRVPRTRTVVRVSRG